MDEEFGEEKLGEKTGFSVVEEVELVTPMGEIEEFGGKDLNNSHNSDGRRKPEIERAGLWFLEGGVLESC